MSERWKVDKPTQTLQCGANTRDVERGVVLSGTGASQTPNVLVWEVRKKRLENKVVF